MAANRKQAGFLVVLMVVSALVWAIQNLPATRGAERGGYETIENCTLLDDRGNDGDSFKVKTPGGETLHLRLYFVDAPETGVRRYQDGNTNVKRLAHQADYFSGLSQEETIGIGKGAKSRVRDRLKKAGSFSVSTKREAVYDSGRIYALVRLKDGQDDRWLHEILVEEGLARIYTQGVDLPGGTSRSAQTKRLKALERKAKEARKGAWELARKPIRS